LEQFKWNYILEDDADEDLKDEDNGEDDEDDSDVDNGDNATSPPATSNKKRKYNAVMGMITPGDDDLMANSNMAKSYPYLLEYQLDINGISNKKISYVRVPRTQSDRSFLNSKEWVDTTIEITGSKRGGTFESAKRITNHIIRYYRC